ncbi:hypothetical protein MRX96_007498 [Rhipicephalus microplus]
MPVSHRAHDGPHAAPQSRRTLPPVHASTRARRSQRRRRVIRKVAAEHRHDYSTGNDSLRLRSRVCLGGGRFGEGGGCCRRFAGEEGFSSSPGREPGFFSPAVSPREEEQDAILEGPLHRLSRGACSVIGGP